MKQDILTRKLNLQPFQEKDNPEECRINVKLLKIPEHLHISFRLRTPMNSILIPPFDQSIAIRKDNLWQHTCFEVFIGTKDGEAYKEFNLSPSGAWNVYSFKGYREGMITDPAFTFLPFDVRVTSEGGLDLTVEIDHELVPIKADTLIGLSAVLELRSGIKSFWAIKHPKPTPDFHAKEGWVNFTD